MKKLSFLICMAIAAASFSFTVPTETTCEAALTDIQFKVINDTGAAFDYYADGQHHTIGVNESAGFSYPAGTVIYKWVNGAQGNAWMTIAAEMQGNSFQLSTLLQ